LINPYKVVEEFEECVAEYAGSKYAVAVDSCTSALMLSLFVKGVEGKKVSIPRFTYVGVAQSILNTGGKCKFRDENWDGVYQLGNDRFPRIIDGARRFSKGMYYDIESFHCLSFHWAKHLPIGRGGMILLNDFSLMKGLKKIRYDGRTAGIRPKDDIFTRGFHCVMHPDDAARGLMLMNYIEDYNDDLPWDGYADLSEQEVFMG